MTIYVVETYSDYLVQIGFSLSEKKAQKIAKECSKDTNRDYFVTQYTVKNNDDYCEFD